METRDDHALRFIEPINRLRAGPTGPQKTNLTLVFSIKTQRHFVRPPDGLRIKRPFINQGFEIVKEIWWRPLGRMTLLQARKVTLAYLNDIAVLLARKYRIVALRATLIDWSTGQPVSPARLYDPWWYARTFGNTPLNATRLRSWGMGVNEGPRVTMLTLETLEYDIDPLLNKIILDVVTDLSETIKGKDRNTLIAARSIIMVLRSQDCIDRLKSYLSTKMQTDEDFYEQLKVHKGKSLLMQAARAWLLKEIEQKVI